MTKERFPESRITDAVSISAQATVGAVPFFGGALSPILATIVAAPLERRRAVWFNQLADGLRMLEEKFEGFDPASLSENEDFASAVYVTTDMAMKTAREEKRKRLENVVLNIAVGRSISEALRERFANLIHLFSEEHILLLRIGQNPLAFPRIAERAKSIMMGGRGSLYAVETMHHGMSDEMFEVVTADLEREQLIHGGFNVTMSGSGLVEPILTTTGGAFLSFISGPMEIVAA